MNGKIIGIEWRSGIDSICIVAVQYERYWQAYIGASRKHVGVIIGDENPKSESELELLKLADVDFYEHHSITEKRTAEQGCKLSWQEAQAFFPSLDITKYKTYSAQPLKLKVKYYKLHLRGIDTKDYQRNPIVFANNDLNTPIGKADLQHKGIVEVTFMDEYYEQFKDETKWTIGPAIAQTNFGNEHLLYLSIIPVLPDYENN